MRKGQVETSELGTTAHLGCIEFRPREESGYTNQILIPLVFEDSIRYHLIMRRKERKAAEKEERRFVTRMDGNGAWRVEDKDTDFELIAKFYHGNEANAKAFARLLNKQARKQATS